MFAEDTPILQTPSDVWGWCVYYQYLKKYILKILCFRAMAALEVSARSSLSSGI
jgi:hypothetical protein